MAASSVSNWRTRVSGIGSKSKGRSNRKNARTPSAQQSMHVQFTYVGVAVHPIGVQITHDELGGTFRVVARKAVEVVSEPAELVAA